MTKHSRLAGAAIAAVLALGSTPSFAQEAGAAQGTVTAAPPVVMVPPVTASPTPAPAATATPAPAPVQDPQLLTRLAPEPPTNVRAGPEPSRTQRAPARTERTAAPAERAAARQTAAAAPAAAVASPAAPEAVTPAGNADFAMTPTDTAPTAAYEPLAPAQAEMVEPPAPVEDSMSLAGIIAALLAVAVAGVGGFLVIGAMRRRRQRIADMEEPVRYEVQREPGPPRRRLSETLRSESSSPAAAAQPVAPQPHVPTAATLAAAGKQETPKPFVVTPFTAYDAPVSAASRSSTQAASTQPASSASEAPHPVPTEPEEREELIQQMVEADPDPVIPFQSRKARRKRARLILQSLQRGFENGRPNFDVAKFCRDWNLALPRRFSRA